MQSVVVSCGGGRCYSAAPKTTNDTKTEENERMSHKKYENLNLNKLYDKYLFLLFFAIPFHSIRNMEFLMLAINWLLLPSWISHK